MLFIVGLLVLALCISAIMRIYDKTLLWFVPWWKIHGVLRFICWMVAVSLAIVILMHFMPSTPTTVRHSSSPLAR